MADVRKTAAAPAAAVAVAGSGVIEDHHHYCEHTKKKDHGEGQEEKGTSPTVAI